MQNNTRLGVRAPTPATFSFLLQPTTVFWMTSTLSGPEVKAPSLQPRAATPAYSTRLACAATHRLARPQCTHGMAGQTSCPVPSRHMGTSLLSSGVPLHRDLMETNLLNRIHGDKPPVI